MNANTNQPRRYRIASVPGDGIGPEVIAAGLEVLEVLAARAGTFTLDVDHYDWGSERYRKTGAFMPDNALSLLKEADAIYFGAVGAPDVPDHVTLWGLRLPICQRLDQYANIRPTRIFPGVKSPLRGVEEGDLDWLIVRENSEGEYSGHGGRAHIGLPEEVATETSIFTRRGVERIMRFAFREAQKRPRKLLTVVTKSNAQRHGLVLWDEIAAEVAGDFPDVTWDKELVDAMTFRMVAKPKSIDTVVATNLHADILSDLTAELSGSLGLGGSLNVGADFAMAQAAHGSAPDIAGRDVANPTSLILSAALLLAWHGERRGEARYAAAARAIEDAVATAMKFGRATRDVGGRG